MKYEAECKENENVYSGKLEEWENKRKEFLFNIEEDWEQKNKGLLLLIIN